MWKEITPFSFSAGERKIMAHFVVELLMQRRQGFVRKNPRQLLKAE